MAKPAARLAFLQVMLGLGAVAVVARAFTVQVVQHDEWARRAEARDIRERDVAPRRGGIFDRDMTPLAATYEAYHVEVAVNELEDVAAARRLIRESLGVSAAQVARQFRGPYPYFDGPFDAMQVQPLRGIKGIHFQPLLGREHPMGDLARPLVGRTDRESGRGIEGIELGFDSLLMGTPGKERVTVDGGGRIVPIPGTSVIEPRPGHDLLLTIDHEVQGIAEGALARAVDQFKAMGGDVVILDVHSGEVLAIASLRTDERTGLLKPGAAALIEPNEPGSTAKIFTAGAAILHGVDDGAESGEGGAWTMPVSATRTRTIYDVHREDGMLTLAQTIQVSSNIVISKFALKLQPHQQYEVLRGFGFGTQPGTGFPGEEGGVLRLPAQSANLRYTMPSWAQGYEFTVTALQVAAAYAAIANGGTLLAPTLLREIRESPSGKVLWRHRPDTVRQAIAPEVAAKMLEFLRLATDSGGTGGGAQLDRWEVIGKTGTAETSPNSVEYRGAFAGIFPGDHPRFVLYVMLDRPRSGSYYGGTVAAPIVRNMLVQALALPNSPLDPGREAAPAPRRTPSPRQETAALPVRRVQLPLRPDSGRAPTGVAVPDLAGWRVREGLHAAHQRGLRPRLVGDGRIVRTEPMAGDTLMPGSTLTIYAELR